ncbi:MAG TPA: M20/M25/M40 family metallo-hydrolase [Thermoanaerobaculia bacterium]|jgi:acetylornithine deacetylase|nr:M20/M25/M40 family metallo-hydrolase [Thermoanaerobaculia bacterium]
MDLFALTRALIDLDSTTGHERAVGDFLFSHLSETAGRTGGRVERMPVVGERFNLFAAWGEPAVVLSTHMDTVPPFFPSSEDDEHVWGRGACDTKGGIAAMVTAITALLAEGHSGFGLLLVVGEETDSVGAIAANEHPRGSRFLVNGEPTENRLAFGSKGALYIEVRAGGRMAHSAYPELGDSAIDKLLAALDRLRAVSLPSDPVLGETTINLGTISGGRAPNVVADEARAEVMIRTVGDTEALKRDVFAAITGAGAHVARWREVPAVRLGSLPGFETTVVKYTTDVPRLSRWGEPFLLGPGSIHVAHTPEERVPKRQLEEAVLLYRDLVRRLSP